MQAWHGVNLPSSKWGRKEDDGYFKPIIKNASDFCINSNVYSVIVRMVVKETVNAEEGSLSCTSICGTCGSKSCNNRPATIEEEENEKREADYVPRPEVIQ